MTDNYDYRVFGDYTELYFTNKKKEEFISSIDTEDLQKLFDFPYTFFPRPNRAGHYLHATEYLGIDSKPINRIIRYHRWILGIDKYDLVTKVDHEDYNTLNNRKYNLRITINQRNLQNRKSANKNNTSGHRNVSFISGNYRVQLQIEGKNYLFPEKFSDVDEAGKFAEEMRLKYYGEFAGKKSIE